MTDTLFAHRARSAMGPLTRAASITPDDAVDLPFESRALMVAAAGDLAVITADGDTLVLPALRPGVIYPLALTRVRASGSTASGAVVLA
ncbi:spike base protein, RCAP_Rcc01079 family [Oceanicaulis sp.]|uniref:spike base protein, RCAP_Rcc01079 family n=1 Tax=Oceanicaulis sp. TaxID=1924941 RepID=UPI003BA8EDF1